VRHASDTPPGQCPMCEGRHARKPGSFAFLHGGALRKFERGGAGPSPGLIGYFGVGFHGAHGQEGAEPSAEIRIAEDTPNGQFELQFCSVSCLRGFLNEAVDELERRLDAEHDA
jgi:hypothetical protein